VKKEVKSSQVVDDASKLVHGMLRTKPVSHPPSALQHLAKASASPKRVQRAAVTKRSVKAAPAKSKVAAHLKVQKPRPSKQAQVKTKAKTKVATAASPKPKSAMAAAEALLGGGAADMLADEEMDTEKEEVRSDLKDIFQNKKKKGPDAAKLSSEERQEKVDAKKANQLAITEEARAQKLEAAEQKRIAARKARQVKPQLDTQLNVANDGIGGNILGNLLKSTQAAKRRDIDAVGDKHMAAVKEARGKAFAAMKAAKQKSKKAKKLAERAEKKKIVEGSDNDRHPLMDSLGIAKKHVAVKKPKKVSKGGQIKEMQQKLVEDKWSDQKRKSMAAAKKKKKLTKASALFSWMIDGKKSAKINHQAMHQIANKAYVPQHEPGEWYRDKFGWKQQPFPAEEKKQKNFAKENTNKRVVKATYGTNFVQKPQKTPQRISSDKTPKAELELLKKLHLG